jgi:hypothetical protein
MGFVVLMAVQQLQQASGTGRTLQDQEWEIVHGAIARMRARIMATVFGMVGGTGLFVATVWLLVKGGKLVGAHLNLLGNYFPGYSVTWGGAVLGFFYGALAGAVLGWSVAWIYNRIADRRHPA